MPTLELADDATKQEINAYVNQVVEDAEGDRKGEEGKTDAQQIAGDQDETEVAETKSGSDGTAKGDSAEGDETGDSGDQAQDWLDDGLKAEVAAYGIDEKELADFSSREELERALRFFDRSAQEAGRKALVDGDKGKDAQGQEADPLKEEAAKSEPREGRYEVSLDKDAYEEDLIGEFTKLRDHYESRIDALEERFTEADVKAEERMFDGLVDSLGHADLFGKTGKENSKQLQRRQDLIVAVKAQQIGLEALGRGVDLDQSLVNRVARMVFTEDLSKKDLKARTRKVSKQSNGRLGGSGTKAHDSQEPLMDEMEQLYKELDNA